MCHQFIQVLFTLSRKHDQCLSLHLCLCLCPILHLPSSSTRGHSCQSNLLCMPSAHAQHAVGKWSVRLVIIALGFKVSPCVSSLSGGSGTRKTAFDLPSGQTQTHTHYPHSPFIMSSNNHWPPYPELKATPALDDLWACQCPSPLV